jgi:hypothetical protein
MDIVHGAREIMQFRACLTTLLQLPLQPTQKMIKRQTTLSRRFNVPAAHAYPDPSPASAVSYLRYSSSIRH